MTSKITTENNFIYLTLDLVLLLFLSAVAEQYVHGAAQKLVTIATVLMLVIGIFSIHRERRWFNIGIGFVIAITAIAIAGSFLEHAGFHYLHLLIMLGFFLLTAWLAIRQVLSPRVAYVNRITGAICFYLLLGMIWAMLYLLMIENSPESFNGVAATGWKENFPHMIYFSFITLTTLGFGDITPALPVPRFFVYMESVVGQFYLAILVASLIGMRYSGNIEN
jgi:voltage-gated potassium channel